MKRSHTVDYENEIYNKIFISDQIMANYMINLSLYNNKTKKPKLVPFPQKPKVSGVIIEEVKNEKLDKIKEEIEFHELRFNSNPLLVGEILPKSILQNMINPDLSNAVVLWKPITLYTNYADNESGHVIHKMTITKKYCDDIDMDEIKIMDICN